MSRINIRSMNKFPAWIFYIQHICICPFDCPSHLPFYFFTAYMSLYQASTPLTPPTPPCLFHVVSCKIAPRHTLLLMWVELGACVRGAAVAVRTCVQNVYRCEALCQRFIQAWVHPWMYLCLTCVCWINRWLFWEQSLFYSHSNNTRLWNTPLASADCVRGPLI